MVSSLNLAYMHLRLEELYGGHDWFGGRNVLFVGDLLQLQPVNGSPVFDKISKKSLCLKLSCAASINIWTDSVVYDELTIKRRQKKVENVSKMLGCVRRGEGLQQRKRSTLLKNVSLKFQFLKLSVSFRRKAKFLCVCFPPENSAIS